MIFFPLFAVAWFAFFPGPDQKVKRIQILTDKFYNT